MLSRLFGLRPVDVWGLTMEELGVYLKAADELASSQIEGVG